VARGGQAASTRPAAEIVELKRNLMAHGEAWEEK